MAHARYSLIHMRATMAAGVVVVRVTTLMV